MKSQLPVAGPYANLPHKTVTIAKELEGYQAYRETKSCYLDGGYFNAIFHDYPGLIPHPLRINYFEEDGQVHKMVTLEPFRPPQERTLLLRVIITPPSGIKHAALVILNLFEKRAIWYNPRSQVEEVRHDELTRTIREYFSDLNIDDESDFVPEPFTPNCKLYGYCNAYVDLFAWAFVNGLQFNPRFIKRFAAKVEDTYRLPGPPTPKQEEYRAYGCPACAQNYPYLRGMNILGGSLYGGPY